MTSETDLDYDYNTDITETKYYTNLELKNIVDCNKLSDLNLLYLNISSLKQNLDKLVNLVAEVNFTPDIIALSETRITKTVNKDFNPSIPNFTYFNIPSYTSAGGVGVFLRNSLNFSLRNDLCCSKNELFETIWIDIFTGKNNVNKTTIGVIYRHNGIANIKTFNEYIETVLIKLNKSKSNYYICGDFNIDTLRWEEFPIISDYIDTMYSHNASMLINKPTRFPIGNQIGAPSILDHFYTNEAEKVKNIGLLINDITDHLPIFAVIQTTRSHEVKNKNILVRDYHNADADKFNRHIEEFNLYINTNTLSIDEKFQKLQEHISICTDKVIPLRKISKRELSFKMKPWISKALQVSIRNKNKLYEKIIKKKELILNLNIIN